MWRRHAARLAARCSRYAAGGGLACFAAGAATGLASWSDGRAACKGKPTTPQLQSFNTRVSDIHLDYEFGPQLGSGAYGNVYRGRCKATGKVVAIKAMPKRKENMAMVRAEVAALRRGALHRSISEIYDFYEAPTNPNPYPDPNPDPDPFPNPNPFPFPFPNPYPDPDPDPDPNLNPNPHFYEAPTVFYIVMEFVDGGELLDH